MQQQVELNRIRTLLSRFEEEVRIDNANGEFSINIHAENVLIKVLNTAYDIDLKNVNYEEGKTYPAIDLIDESKRITFQISSTGTVKKVTDTLKTFAKRNQHEKYDHLYFYFLKGKEKKVVINNASILTARGKLKRENIHFLDHAEFYKHLNQINDIHKYIKIRELLEQQFADPVVLFLPANGDAEHKSIVEPSFKEPTITFLIGNGFDLSIGMKTGYTDFIEWYSQRDLYDIKIKYLAFAKSHLSDPMRWNTWSDFESDLVGFASQTSSDKERIEFKELYIDVLNKIAEYIRFNQRTVLQKLRLQDSAFFEKIKESILNWHNELTEEQKAGINGHNIFCKSSSDYKRKFINFNYSVVFDEILRSALDEQDIIHIHGSIDSPGNLVMGVDDAILISTCFKEEELYYLLKNHNIDKLQERWNQTAEDFLQKSNIVCIYGMSIGRTDSAWWKKIIKWLLLDGHNLVIFWHTSNKDELVDLKALRNTVINRLFSFGDLRDNEKYSLMTKIQVVINPDEFLQVT